MLHVLLPVVQGGFHVNEGPLLIRSDFFGLCGDFSLLLVELRLLLLQVDESTAEPLDSSIGVNGLAQLAGFNDVKKEV